MIKTLKFRNIFLTSVFILCTASNVYAEDSPDSAEDNSINIDIKDIPLDVIAFIKENWNFIIDENIIDVEKIKQDQGSLYEIEFENKLDNEKINVLASEHGAPIEIEKSISIESLPKAVTDAIKTAYPDMEINESDIVFEIKYDVEGKTGGHTCELEVLGSGTILENECETNEKQQIGD